MNKEFKGKKSVPKLLSIQPALIITSLFIILMITSLVIVVIAEPILKPDEKYTFEQFKKDFDVPETENQVTLATEYSEYYMTLIKDKPEVIGKNIEAYESVIGKDVNYLNADKLSFMKYAEIKGIKFSAVDGDFKSFDKKTGRFVTRGKDGESVVEFGPDNIIALSKSMYYDFKIDEAGKLSYKKGDFSTMIHKGTLGLDKIPSLSNGIIEIIGLGKNEVIEVSGKSNILFPSYSPAMLQVVDEPIVFSYGILLKGGAVFNPTMNNKIESIFFFDSPIFKTKEGTIIEIEKGKGFNLVESNKIDICEFNTCVQEQPGGDLIVDNKINEMKIKITTTDGLYKNIIVGQLEGLGYGNYEKKAVILTLINGENREFIFTEGEKPIYRGNINGLKSNIATIFSVSGKDYPWLIYNDKPTLNVIGETDQNVVNTILKLSKEDINSINREKLELILGVGINQYDARTLLKEKQGDIEFQTKIINSLKLKKLEDRLSFIKDTFLPHMMVKGIEEHPEDYTEEVIKAFENIEQLQLKLLESIDLIDEDSDGMLLSSLEYAISDKVKKALFEKKRILSNSYLSSGNYFQTIEELNKLNINVEEYLKNAIPNNYDTLRITLTLLENKPDAFKSVLRNSPASDYFDPKKFEEIYFNDKFQEKIKTFEEQRGEKLSFANKYSLTLSVQHLLDTLNIPQDKSNEDVISDVTDVVLEHKDDFEKYTIFDDKTYYLLVTHEEKAFENSRMVKIGRDHGVKKIPEEKLKGPNAKDDILKLIEKSENKGKTTVWFNNHGGQNHQWLQGGSSERSYSNEMNRGDAISYMELGNSLINRGKLEEVSVIIDSCYSYDFTRNLYNYLYKEGIQKGHIQEMPTIITETNRRQLGWLNDFTESLEKLHKEGEPKTPLTGKIMSNIETDTFFRQDMAVFRPFKESSKKKLYEKGYKFKKEERILPMGSSYDDGSAEAPISDTGKTENDDVAPVNPAYIEISKIEPELQKKLQQESGTSG